MAALLTWTTQQRGRERWAREEAMPQLQALIDQDDYVAAFDLSQRIAHVVPNDPQLRALESMHSAPVTLDTDPAGAVVYFKPYDAPESAWRYLGRTPLVGVPVPKGVGIWRFELPGHVTVVRTFRNVSAELKSDPLFVEGFDGVDLTAPLPEATAMPEGMVHVPARSLEVALDYTVRALVSPLIMRSILQHSFLACAGPEDFDVPAYFAHTLELILDGLRSKPAGR